MASDKAPSGAAGQIEEAINQLHQAQKLIAQLQTVFPTGATWHALESIDDRLHDALTALGD